MPLILAGHLLDFDLRDGKPVQPNVGATKLLAVGVGQGSLVARPLQRDVLTSREAPTSGGVCRRHAL